MERTLEYLHTHKPNLLGYYAYKANDCLEEYCETIGSCSECDLNNWCRYRPWTRRVKELVFHLPYLFKEKIYSPLFTFFWCRFKKDKCLTCSRCGWKEDLRVWQFIDTDFKKIDGKWVCHHCQYHTNDDCVDGKRVSHEEFEEYWRQRVLEQNKEIEEREK